MVAVQVHFTKLHHWDKVPCTAIHLSEINWKNSTFLWNNRNIEIWTKSSSSSETNYFSVGETMAMLHGKEIILDQECKIKWKVFCRL